MTNNTGITIGSRVKANLATGPLYGTVKKSTDAGETLRVVWDGAYLPGVYATWSPIDLLELA